MKRGEPNRRANKWVARVIPLLLLALIGYSCWVVTKLICVDYLLVSTGRTGPAIAILTILYILLTSLVICYGRVIETIIINPGLVPRGAQWYIEKNTKSRSNRSSEKDEGVDVDLNDKYNRRQSRNGTLSYDESYRVDEFWQKDIFTCKFDGRPAFCSSCYNYKPDRAHHCRELDRCVVKMDHFCPWVGGIVSETSFKYFIQFTGSASLFCLHVLVVVAYYFAERQRADGFLDANWIVVMAVAGLFLFFAGGMCFSSLQLAAVNSTTIENLGRKTQVWYIAVYIPEHILQSIPASTRQKLRLITYPRPPEEQLQILQSHGVTLSQTPGTHEPTSTGQELSDVNITGTESSPNQPPVLRTFAILETEPGSNPFDIGYFNNLKEVMGYSFFDWISPIKPSPLTRHDSPNSMYKMGHVVQLLKRDAGIPEDLEKRRHSSHRKRRKRREHRSSG